MLEKLINIALAFSRPEPTVRISIRSCRRLASAELRELHAFSAELLKEDFDHFTRHALTNNVVHIFRRKEGGAIVGFQFWRVLAMTLPGSAAILGGKLRIAPGYRNRGLHLVSGLAFFLARAVRHPWTRHYRLSVASIFGFVSLTSALSQYHLLAPHGESTEERAIEDAFRRIADENHFRMAPQSPLMFVNIYMHEATLTAFPPEWYDRPLARRYTAVNPEFRSNGAFVNFWFRFTPRNLVAILRQLRRKLFRNGSPV